jgi:hypothetical protein
MSRRERHHAALLAGLANQPEQLAGIGHNSGGGFLDALESMRIISLPEAARLAGVSVDTLRRQHSDKILKMSEKRRGMRLRTPFRSASR